MLERRYYPIAIAISGVKPFFCMMIRQTGIRSVLITRTEMYHPVFPLSFVLLYKLYVQYRTIPERILAPNRLTALNITPIRPSSSDKLPDVSLIRLSIYLFRNVSARDLYRSNPYFTVQHDD